MTKLEIIENKQVLTESEDRKPAKQKEREVTLPSGAKVKARTVQGWQSQKADKEADKEKKKDLDENVVFQSAIAKELLKEFNISVESEEGAEDSEETLDEADAVANPYKGADAEKFAAMSPEDQAWLTKGGGVPDISGQGLKNGPDFNPILARAPNKGQSVAGAATKPAGTPAGGVDDEGNIMPGFTTDEQGNVVKADDPNFVEPATQALAQQGRADAMAANQDAEDQAMGKAMTANAAAADIAKTRERFKALLDKLEKTGGSSGAPAAGAATKPAAPKAKPTTGAATKPAAPAAAQPDWNMIGASQMTAEGSVSADDQILALIKNI